MRSVSLAALALTLTAGSAAAQVPLAADVEHPFASRLPGAWRHDAALAEALGEGGSDVREFEWQPDPSGARDLPADCLPDGHTAYACGLVRVALDGRIVTGVGLLTSAHGSAHLVVLGNDLDPWIAPVSLLAQPDPSRDALFLSGVPLRRTAGANTLAWNDLERELADAVGTDDELNVRRRRGELLLRVRSPLRALEEFQRALSAEPSYLSLVDCARAYVAIERAELELPTDPSTGRAPHPLLLARQQLEEAVDLDEQRPEAYHVLADAFRAAADTESELRIAARHDQIALRYDEGFHPARLGLARTTALQGDFAHALSLLDPLLRETSPATRARASVLTARTLALAADPVLNLVQARRALGPDATSDAVEARAHADRRDHLARARALLEDARELDPTAPDAWLELARVASALDDTDAALRAAQAAVDLLQDRPFPTDLDPDLPTARALLAALRDAPPADHANQPLACSALALHLLRADPEDPAPRALLTLARTLRDFTPPTSLLLPRYSHDTQRLRLLNKAGQLAWDDPLHADARLAQAELALRLGAPEAAHAAAELAVAADPLHPHAHLLLGRAALRNDDAARAHASFQRALKLTDDPQLRSEAHAGCGRASILRATDSTDPAWFEGRADLARAEQPLPDDLSQLDTSEIERRRRLLEDLVQFDAAAAGRSKDALQHAHDTLRAEVARLAELARLRSDQRDYSAAIDALDRLLTLDDDHAQAHYLMGAALLRIGNFIPGLFHFARSVELDPSLFDDIYTKLYQISYVVDMDRVVLELNLVVPDHPDRAAAHFLRGAVLLCRAEFAPWDPSDAHAGIADCDTALEENSFFVGALAVRARLHDLLALESPDPGERADAADRADADFALLAQLRPDGATDLCLHAQHLAERPADGDADLRADLDHRALSLLRRAVESGFDEFERLEDPSFDPLRAHPEFRALLPR